MTFTSRFVFPRKNPPVTVSSIAGYASLNADDVAASGGGRDGSSLYGCLLSIKAVNLC